MSLYKAKKHKFHTNLVKEENNKDKGQDQWNRKKN